MLHSVSSVAIYLATGSAFVVRAPRVAPADSAGSKQDSATAPLGAVGERLGTGGALTRLGGMDNKKAGHRLPRVSLAGCYRGWGGRDICPLYMVKGVQVRVFLQRPRVGACHQYGRVFKGLMPIILLSKRYLFLRLN